MEGEWTDELAAYLTELSAVQDELLGALEQKHAALTASDHARLDELSALESALAERLRLCHERRAEILARAAAIGKPHASIRILADSLPASERIRLAPRVDEAMHKTRVLQHECLTNWVVVQRTMLHLSQMLEIIATGGRRRPTYGKEDCAQAHGVLVDHAV